jgi:hypothetical protein
MENKETSFSEFILGAFFCVSSDGRNHNDSIQSRSFVHPTVINSSQQESNNYDRRKKQETRYKSHELNIASN